MTGSESSSSGDGRLTLSSWLPASELHGMLDALLQTKTEAHAFLAHNFLSACDSGQTRDDVNRALLENVHADETPVHSLTSRKWVAAGFFFGGRGEGAVGVTRGSQCEPNVVFSESQVLQASERLDEVTRRRSGWVVVVVQTIDGVCVSLSMRELPCSQLTESILRLSLRPQVAGVGHPESQERTKVLWSIHHIPRFPRSWKDQPFLSLWRWKFQILERLAGQEVPGP